MTKNRIWLMVSAIAIITIIFSGCIDVYYFSERFAEKGGKKEVAMKEVDKLNINHVFNTNANPDTWSYAKSEIVEIKVGTEYLQVSIEVVIQAIPADIPEIPEPQRYFHIRILMADGTVWYDYQYNQTTKDSFTIYSPMHGPWRFEIDAVGIGSDIIGIHDQFSVRAVAKEIE